MMVAAGGGENPPVTCRHLHASPHRPACFNLPTIASVHRNSMFGPPLQPNAPPGYYPITDVGFALTFGYTPYWLLQAIAHDSTPAQLTLGKELSRDELWASDVERVALAIIEKREWEMWEWAEYYIEATVQSARKGRLGLVVPGDGIGSYRERLEYRICNEGMEVCYRCQVSLRGD